ncbi:CPBP family intramembrane glutamic endopeptidase [Vallitalea maricola]|uniref:Type II CAAX endopeptidase family protein n=1 Tax=Vallitalea maricola TaxID=3074433 RepID=A0ACB5UMK0_9FIRM|nr:type II CAAX endopeptidase family protein [Vallitalea sp. AN17-2]
MNLFKNKHNKIYSGIKITLIIAFYFTFQKAASSLFNPLDFTNYYTVYILIKSLSVVALIIAFILVYKLEKRSPRKFGVIISKQSLKHLLIGLVLGALSITIIALLLFATDNATLTYSFDEPIFSFNLIYVLIIFILVGIDEELLVRGYIVHTLHRYNNKYVVYIIPAVIFSALHLLNPNVSVVGLINIVLIGILFTYMTLKTQNILMAIGYHITWNFFQGGFFGFNVSGSTLWDSVYPVRIIHDNLLTGGEFGLEGGILTTLLFVIMTMVVYLIPVGDNQY